MYINLRKLFSYNMPIMAIVGARGIGKSFGVKRFLIHRFFEYHEMFVWLRTTETMCDEVCSAGGEKFKEDLIIAKTFPYDWDLKIVNYEVYVKRTDTTESLDKVDWQLAGYVLPISTYQKFKGTVYTAVENICYDEFIEEVESYTRGNKLRQFCNMIETIGRLRTDYRLFLLANALNVGDPLLNTIAPRKCKFDHFGYYVNKELNSVIYYADNSRDFNIKRDTSIAGKLTKASGLEDIINNNKFETNDDLIITPKRLTYIRFKLNVDGKILYCFLNDGQYIVTKQTDVKTEVVMYSKNVKTRANGCDVISTNMLNRLRLLYGRRMIKFDSESTHEYFKEFIK